MGGGTERPVETTHAVPAPRRRKWITPLLAILSAGLGAAATLGAEMYKESRELSTAAPVLNLSSVTIHAPELPIELDGRPAPPALVVKRLAMFEEKLGLTEEAAHIPTDRAKRLLDVVAKSTLFESLSAGTEYLEIDAWKRNIETAAEQLATIDINVKLLERVGQLLANPELDDTEVRKRFVALIDEEPRNPHLLAGLGIPYQVQVVEHGAAARKRLAAEGTRRLQRPVLFDLFPQSTDSGADDFLLMLGRRGVGLDSESNVTVGFANKMLAVSLSRFDRGELTRLAGEAVQIFNRERGFAKRFVEESQNLLRKELKAKVEVRATAFNRSRTPTTLKPYAALRIKNGKAEANHLDVGLALVPDDEGELPEPGTEKSVSYVTVASGEFENLTLLGELSAEAPSQWVFAAYEESLLDCTLTVETVGRHRAMSQLSIGKTHDSELKAAESLAEPEPE